MPLQALRFHPRNIRANLGDLTALAESIRAEGVLVPLMAEKRPTGGLRLLHGHRRWAAADMAGLRRVPVTIVAAHTDDEAILVMLAENTGRAEVAPPDLQAAIRSLVDEFGWSPGAVAKRLGVARAMVEDWGAGRTSRPRTLAGRVSPEVAPKAGRAPRAWRPTIRPRVVHELLARWDTGEVDAATLVAELRGWLGDWTPTGQTKPAAATPVPDDVVAQVDWLDREGAPAGELATKIGCDEKLIWRARGGKPPGPEASSDKSDWAAVEGLVAGRLRAEQVRRVDRRAAVAELSSRGVSAAAIADRIGMSKAAVEQVRYRARRAGS